MDETGGMGHRLAASSSRYLRQHADNPVDWHPWGEEAFAEARRRDVPVFVSIGYSACHWCHVMAGESFEDPEVAQLLRDRFVSIKVDREEHPDVDDTYMAAVQAMTGQGGWPMSVFTTPEGRVFHAGTYFPPRRRGQIPSFTEVLDAVHTAWTQRREEVDRSAEQIAHSLGRQRRQQGQIATTVGTGEDAQEGDGGGVGDRGAATSAEVFGTAAAQALEVLAQQEDTAHGGFGSAPKFPPSPLLGHLLEQGAWEHLRGSSHDAAGLALRTMEAMGRSALFDQIEGGFARYATDRAWQLPHFEKMLYDNAQLIGHFARLSVHPAADEQQRVDAARAARMSIDWLRRRLLLSSADGSPDLVASSLDADTVDEHGRHEEGATYLFSDVELKEAALAAGLTAQEADQLAGLNRGVPADEHALASGAPLNITEHTPRTLHFDAPLTGQERQLWDQALPELRRRRDLRNQPARDEKVVAAWNAQAVASLAEAAALWADAELLSFAEALGERLWQTHVELGEGAGAASGATALVYRTSYAGRRGPALGTLGDHAQMVNACLALASAGAGSAGSSRSEGSSPSSGTSPAAAGIDAAGWAQRGHQVLHAVLERFVRRQAGAFQAGERQAGEQQALVILESADEGGPLAQAQYGVADASPFDGPEPSSVAALAQALQTAEALQSDDSLGWERLPVVSTEILHHVAFAAPKAPQVVGASMRAALRAARQSPAFRVVGGSAEHVAAVRRAGALYGVPVEPVSDGVVQEGAPLRLSVCLNGDESILCLPPVNSAEEALASIG